MINNLQLGPEVLLGLQLIAKLQRSVSLEETAASERGSGLYGITKLCLPQALPLNWTLPEVTLHWGPYTRRCYLDS